MNIWIFGDSFAELNADYDNEWQIQLSKHFKSTLYNVAHNGASSEWITLQLSKYWNDISKEDIVIVLVPYWDRQCIFIDDPDFNHLVTISKDAKKDDRWKKYTKEQQEAFTQYFMYLHNESIVRTKTTTLYSWINNLKTDIKPLVLETRNQEISNPFENIYATSHGYLMDVSIAEWANPDDWYSMTNKALYDDPRMSHMHQKNHNVLAEKIIKHFEQNESIDLTNGFHSNFLNKDCIDIHS